MMAKSGERTAVSEPTLVALMTANLDALGQVKSREFQWSERYTVLTAPAVGYLALRDPTSPLAAPLVASVMASYWLITLWFQKILTRERHGYYRLMRSIVRIQNLLGLYESWLLAPEFANAAFPRGFGPNKSIDGTKPYSSFLHMQLYTMVFLAAVLAAGVYQRPDVWWLAVLLLLADIGFVARIFIDDRRILIRDTQEEADLAGWNSAWSPD